jgi:glucosamine--fructose-6-phosphate aminotransferase (isomerizing)
VLSESVNVIEGQYFRDLMAQPAALDASLAWLSHSGRWREVSTFLAAQSWKRVVLTGMGSSYHSLHPLNLTLIGAGFTPVLIETSELVHYGGALLDEQTLTIAASQSGRSAETLRLLQLNQRSPMLGITNTADSPLAQSSDCLLLIQAGTEASVSCKTYVSMILALRWLGAVVCGRQESETLGRLAPAAVLADNYLQNWRAYTQVLAEKLRSTRHLFFTGRGDSLAAAGTGALIVKEAAHFHAEGMSSAAFRHGPMEMLQSQMRTVVFSGDLQTGDLNRQLIRDLTAKGGHCEEIGADSAFPALRLARSEPELRPILEILPVQMMTLALAALSGREAGRFQHATKITAVE